MKLSATDILIYLNFLLLTYYLFLTFLTYSYWYLSMVMSFNFSFHLSLFIPPENFPVFRGFKKRPVAWNGLKTVFKKLKLFFFWHVKLSSHKSSYVYCYYRSKRSLVLYGKLPLLGCGFLRFTLRFEIISAKLKALWKLWKMLLISP